MAVSSILSAKQFNRNEINEILDLAFEIEKRLESTRIIPVLNDYILAALFFEPSTRTRLSFETAMHKLGGRVISSVGVQFSSLAKGESLYDTLKMVEAYSDICVIRHSVEGASVLAAKEISIPVINGGDGAGEHPTQALLDLYTIEKHKKISDTPLVIAFVGDIKYGRTIHSLLYLLSHYKVELVFISPTELALPQGYREFLENEEVKFTETEDIGALKDADIGYITRIQEERFLNHRDFERFKDSYIINNELLSGFKNDIRIMHPLPRLNEVGIDVDSTANAVYFDQAKNGVYVRMALLLRLLNEKI